MIYVGKASANHTMRQPDINKLLVKLAAAGKTVARLKGGDPFVFGRGGEEAIELKEAGLPFEFVPVLPVLLPSQNMPAFLLPTAM